MSIDDNTTTTAPLYSDMPLPPVLQEALTHVGYTHMTPIQAQVIPVALEGRDVLGSSQTGSGKTAAFAVPIITKLMSAPTGSALILTPTRELAMQVMDVIQKLCHKSHSIKTALLIGGQSIFTQRNQLRAGRVRLFVGTPGRINDHLERGNLKLNDTEFLVLDEADRMLDMGFDVQLEAIEEYLPAKRQTMMFSATFSDEILDLSKRYLTEPVRVTIGTTSKPAANIKQEVVRLKESEKYKTLIKELDAREGSIIIFVKTKIGADKLVQQLQDDDHSAEAIHGDLRQRERSKVIRDFRSKAHRIMVATDVAARGLDIPHIEHVINYDLPQSPEDYVHRIGRTARAGAEGAAVSFITEKESRKWMAIEDLIDPEAAKARRATMKRTAPPRRRPVSRTGTGGSWKDSYRSGPRSESGPRREGGFRRESGPGREGGPRREGAPRSDRSGNSFAKPRASYGDSRSEGRGFAKPRASYAQGRSEGNGFSKPRASYGDSRSEGRGFAKAGAPKVSYSSGRRSSSVREVNGNVVSRSSSAGPKKPFVKRTQDRS